MNLSLRLLHESYGSEIILWVDKNVQVSGMIFAVIKVIDYFCKI